MLQISTDTHSLTGGGCILQISTDTHEESGGEDHCAFLDSNADGPLIASCPMSALYPTAIGHSG